VTRSNGTAPDSPFARVIEVRSGVPTALEEEAPVEDLVGSDEIEVVDPLAVGIDLPALFHLLPRSGEVGSGV